MTEKTKNLDLRKKPEWRAKLKAVSTRLEVDIRDPFLLIEPTVEIKNSLIQKTTNLRGILEGKLSYIGSNEAEILEEAQYGHRRSWREKTEQARNYAFSLIDEIDGLENKQEISRDLQSALHNGIFASLNIGNEKTHYQEQKASEKVKKGLPKLIPGLKIGMVTSDEINHRTAYMIENDCIIEEEKYYGPGVRYRGVNGRFVKKEYALSIKSKVLSSIEESKKEIVLTHDHLTATVKSANSSSLSSRIRSYVSQAGNALLPHTLSERIACVGIAVLTVGVIGLGIYKAVQQKTNFDYGNPPISIISPQTSPLTMVNKKSPSGNPTLAQ